MISLSGVLLGLINIGIVIVILVLIGAVVAWVLAQLQWPIPWDIQRLYLAVVALIALYMLVALLFGLPSVRLIGGELRG
jgi:carbon starvation protein CstA